MQMFIISNCSFDKRQCTNLLQLLPSSVTDQYGGRYVHGYTYVDTELAVCGQP